MRGEFVDVGGERLYYYAAGTRGPGEPLVLVHGFPTSSHLWARVVPLLPPGHRVVVVDLLGYGRSDRPRGSDMSILGHARRLLGLFDILGIRAATVAGHHLGGGIALEIAVEAPARVRGLCLVNTVAFDTWPGRAVRLARSALPILRRLPGSAIRAILRTGLRRGYASPDLGAHSVEQFVRPFSDPDGVRALLHHLAAMDAGETGRLTPRLGAIRVPTSIVWGAGDPWLPASIGRRLQEAIPGATLDVVDGAAHFVPEDAPSRVSGAIAGLLAR